MLIVLFVAYWLFPRSWWPVLTFALLCVTYLALAVAWWVEYKRLQKKRPAPAFVISFICFALALLIGSLLAAPNPLVDFTDWRNVSRWLYGIGLPFFAIGVYIECWRVYRGVEAQEENKKPGG